MEDWYLAKLEELEELAIEFHTLMAMYTRGTLYGELLDAWIKKLAVELRSQRGYEIDLVDTKSTQYIQ